MHFMVSLVTAVLFFIWILPLGIFFKPSLEKFACGGQRAICLCSHGILEGVKSSPIEGFGLKSSAGGHKESTVSKGGVGQEYVSNKQFVLTTLAGRKRMDPLISAYRNPSLKLIEHIPKA